MAGFMLDLKTSLLQNILNHLATQAIVEGTTGLELNETAESLLRLHKVESAFKGYRPDGRGPTEGYPAVLCVSINGEVIHGIPDKRKFYWGDVVKLDLGLKQRRVTEDVPSTAFPTETGEALEIWDYDDGAITVIVGDPGAGSSIARRLVAATKEALQAGIAQAKVGKTTNDIGTAIYEIARREGFSVIMDYSGHGIGTALHMAPDVPNHPISNPVPLVAGMRLAIEPMFSSKRPFTVVDKANKWTVKLNGGGVTAHFEQTVTVE